MITDPLKETTKVKVAKFAIVFLGMLGMAVAAFLLADYISNATGARVPVANLFWGLVVCTAGLVLAGMALHGRGPWTEVAGLAVPALIAALAALRFGLAGVVVVYVVAHLVYLALRWQRAKRLPKVHET